MGGAFYDGVAGTIRQRGKRWQVDTTINGRRIRKAAPARPDAEALLAELNRGNLLASPMPDQRRREPSNLTVTAMLGRYLGSTRLHCPPRTIRTTEAVVRRLIELFGDRSAATLSRTDVDRYTAQRLSDT